MNSRPEWGWIALLFAARLRRAAYPAARFSMAEFESSQGGVSHIATRAQVLRIARYCEMQSHPAMGTDDAGQQRLDDLFAKQQVGTQGAQARRIDGVAT